MRSWNRRMGLLAGLLAATWAQAQAPAAADAELLKRWVPAAQQWLQAPAPGKLEPALQQAVAEVTAVAQQRVAELAPGWLAQLRQDTSFKGPEGAVEAALWRRVVNELALWHLQPLSPALTEGWIAAATRPDFCALDTGEVSWMGRQLSRWSLLPADARAELLASERAAMARFGDAPTPPPRPVPGAMEAASAALDGLRRAAGPRPQVQIPPVLAYWAVAKAQPVAAQDPVVRCALNQWWLREQLARAAPGDAAARARALLAFRYAWLPEAQDISGHRPLKDTSGKPEPPGIDYPTLARQQEVTGEVTVTASLDAAGVVRDARVTDRKLRAVGVPGRPVAFETLLDAAALAKARTPGVLNAPPQAGDYTVSFLFKLD
jgi:hypothetical protein